MALNVKGLGEGFVSGFGLADDYYARKGAAEMATRRQTAAEKESGQLADYRSATLEQQREAAAAADARGKAELALREQANADDAEYKRGSLENARRGTEAEVAARKAQTARENQAVKQASNKEILARLVEINKIVYTDTQQKLAGNPGFSESQLTGYMSLSDQLARDAGRLELSASYLINKDIPGAAARMTEAVQGGKNIDLADFKLLIPSVGESRRGRPNAEGKIIESEEIRNLGSARLRTSEAGVQYYEFPVLQRLQGGGTSVDTIRVGAEKDEKSGIQLTFRDLASRANSTNYLASLWRANPAVQDMLGQPPKTRDAVMRDYANYERQMIRFNTEREMTGQPPTMVQSLEDFAKVRGFNINAVAGDDDVDTDGPRFDYVADAFPEATNEQRKNLYRAFQSPSGGVPAPGRMLTDALARSGLDSVASQPEHVLALTNEAAKRAAARVATWSRKPTNEETTAIFATEVDSIVAQVAQRAKDRAASRPVTPARTVTPPPR